MIKSEPIIKIAQIEKSDKSVINTVVDIHLATFKGFFLTFMGRGFLRQMYSSYCEHNASALSVAFDGENKPVGFLAYSEDMSGLYKFMIKKHLIPFAWYSLGAFFRKPKVFMRLIRAFLKPGEAARQDPYVELASIGVDPQIKSRGIGTALINEMKKRVDFEKYSYISLETDALDNEAANNFYVKNGFVKFREYETREGRKMNEYRFGEKHENTVS